MKFHHYLLYLVVSPLFSFGQTVDSGDMQQARSQLADYLLAQPATHDTRMSIPILDTNELIQTLDSEGKWPDIDYTDQTNGAWLPNRHISRLNQMILDYRLPASGYYEDPTLKAVTLHALDFWLETGLQSPNWYHNEIYAPRKFGHFIILFGEEMSPLQYEGCMDIVSVSNIGMTGQNKVNLAQNVLVRGLIEENVDMIDEAKSAIVENVAITEDEGLQVDYSYHQHGPQLQWGNYGLGFAESIAAWVKVLAGTDLAFDTEKVSLLRNYLLEGLTWACWMGQMDISACGRQLFEDAPIKKSSQVRTIIETLRDTDPANLTAYDEAIESFTREAGSSAVITGNRHFWESDIMIDRRSGYYASVKMSSDRVIPTENVNDENKKGFYLGDGALYIYKTGREYENLMPVWNWRSLPGTTSLHRADLLTGRRPFNDRIFVGGVTDGSDGVAALDYNRPAKSIWSKSTKDVSIKKSWFFFDGEIIALGAGLQTEFSQQDDGTMLTTLNQSHANGPVYVGTPTDGSTLLPAGHQDFTDLQWAWHDDIGYVLFDQPAKTVIGTQTQQGTWSGFYTGGSSDIVEEEVFSMWIEHVNPTLDGGYAYAMLPTSDVEETALYAENPSAKIISNTTSLQAVTSGKLTSAIFYTAGSLQYSDTALITVDQPCMLMIRDTDDGRELSVSDPTQLLSALTVTFEGTTYPIDLPSGLEAGKSLTISIPSTTVVPIETWRQDFFGTTENSGNAADNFDYDSDSLDNLIEYLTGSDPTLPSPSPVDTSLLNSQREFSFNWRIDSGYDFSIGVSTDLANGFTYYDSTTLNADLSPQLESVEKGTTTDGFETISYRIRNSVSDPSVFLCIRID